MTVQDAFARVTELDGATVSRLIDRLEFRGRDPFFVQMRDAYLDRMALDPGATVLEVGCGTGVVVRALVQRAGFSGTVIGIDPSPVFIDAARKLAAEEGLADRIQLEVGDGHALTFPDAHFDAVLAHTVISHVTDPRALLGECARVVRPGGQVAVFDGDYASWTFAHPDHDLARAMEEAVIGAVVNNPRVLRDMPRMLSEAGLERTETLADVYADIGAGGFFGPAIEAYGPLAVSAGLATAEAMDGWLEDQRQAREQGQFFAACNYYTYLARRRPRPDTGEG
jgi:SAM-dependent methyltransferase